MDKEALEHDLVRRLHDHLEHGTTDLADEVLEVPCDIYTSRSHYEDEIDALFLDHPIVFALSGALPDKGSYFTVDLFGTPILLSRNHQGQVKALVNTCRHRGVRVMDGRGRTRRFVCPFHAWSYDIDGKLTGVPTGEAFEGMCKDDKGLVELPVAEGYGLIVGRLRPGAPVDVDEYLGPELSGELATLDFADWAPYSEPHVHEVGANWKVTLDTFRENYHFNVLHKETLAGYAYGGVLTFDPFGLHLRNSSAVRSIDALKGVPEAEWTDVAQHFSYQYALFPNTSLTFDARHIELWQILPVDEANSVVVHTAYMRPNLSEEELAKLVDMAPWICDTVVDGEDFWVAGRTEPGIRSGLLDTVVFGMNEPAPQHLHQGFLAVVEAHKAAKAEASETPVDLATD